MFTLNKEFHYYEHSAYGRVPSVSEILNLTESKEDKDRLRKWQHKMDKVHGAGSSGLLRQSAADRGSMLHSCIEKYWSDSVTPDRDSEVYGFFNSVLPFLQSFKAEDVLYFEKIFGCLEYAGTVDFVGRFHGEVTTFDFTTSTRPKRKAWLNRKFLQCAAYSHLMLSIGVVSKQLGVVVVLPDQPYQLFLADLTEYLTEWLARLNDYKRLVEVKY
jgi:hypothetical protein